LGTPSYYIRTSYITTFTAAPADMAAELVLIC